MNEEIIGTTNKRKSNVELDVGSTVSKVFLNKTIIRSLLDDEDENDAVKNLGNIVFSIDPQFEPYCPR